MDRMFLRALADSLVAEGYAASYVSGPDNQSDPEVRVRIAVDADPLERFEAKCESMAKRGVNYSRQYESEQGNLCFILT